MNIEKHLYEILEYALGDKIHIDEINNETEFRNMNIESLDYLKFIAYLEQDFNISLKKILFDEGIVFDSIGDILIYLNSNTKET